MATNDEDDVWNPYMKKEKAIRPLRAKSFPLYLDWCKIWDKDKATGEFSETPNDAANNLQQNTYGGSDVHDLDAPNVGLEGIDVSVSVTQNKLPKKFGAESRKRKRMNEEMVKELNKNLEKSSKAMERVANSLQEMVGCIGHEKDQSTKREQLYEQLEPLGLSLTKRVSVVMLLASKSYLLDVFCGFKNDEARMEMVKIILEDSHN